MSDIEKPNLIRSMPIFSQLPETGIQLIASLIKVAVFPPHHIFIEQDDISGSIYFIFSGSVRIYKTTVDGDERGLAIEGPGAILGEMAFFEGLPRSANVETLQETKALILTRNDFNQILLKFPDIAFSLLKILSSRLRETGQQLEDVLSKNLTQRTWQALQTLANYFPNKEITLSHEELAQIIGATRARVTESLDELSTSGKITLSHRKIKIK